MNIEERVKQLISAAEEHLWQAFDSDWSATYADAARAWDHVNDAVAAAGQAMVIIADLRDELVRP